MLDYYANSLASLFKPANAEVAFAFVNDSEDPTQRQILCKLNPAAILETGPRPADAGYAIGVDTHHWQVSTFEHLAAQKQRLLQYAIEHHYTHVFLVDSDLLLEPTTLVSLWETKQDIVNAVFWTRWQAGGPAQPQCWLMHPYGLAGLGMEEHEYVGALAERQVVRCLGGGACTLIATDALKKGVRYHPRLPLPEGGMWQGEDRTFAVLAQRLHERQLADGWSDIYHAYHPAQRTETALAEAWSVLNAPRQQHAKYGDMVNIVLDPLEDPPLAQALAAASELRCIRGRLGGIKMAPELEAKVLEMEPGQEALVNIKMPPWHPLGQYRNQQKVVRMRLVDCKPYSYAPVLHEDAFAGVAE